MTSVRPDRVSSVSTIFVFLVVALLAVSSAAAVCGDGVLDPSEDCDDGSSQNGGTNSCCTAACTLSGKSPDVIVGDLPDTTNWGAVGGIQAYSIGTTSCNLGSCWLNWIASSPNKPIIGQNMYRLKNGRFEQIGQSWLKHAFTALQGSVCSASCVASPSNHLGVNCSDPYSSGLNGGQGRLGPKSDVNPNTGVYLYPDARITTTGDVIFKHLQVHITDLDPAQNAGAAYFVEGQYVTLDDAAAKNNTNNASYRPVTVGGAPNYNLSLTSTTARGKMAIQAWKATDPSVTETFVGASEGLFVVSAKATSLGGGIYHYEYAVENLTNHRAGQSFSVPFPAGTVITTPGFHDVDYHSGEPFDGTDWTATVGATSVTWATTTYDVNPNANALRWGTLYNFRFDANLAPGFATTTIGLFKPGTPSGATFTTVAPNACFGAANGTPCTDGNGCTLTDTCQSGTCQGATPVVCNALDACHTSGTCNPDTGICSNPTAANGTTCNDGNGCTQTDACQAGVCLGSNPVVCVPSDACHSAGTCGPATGVCSNPAKPNGTACSDGNGCTQTDTCQSGLCTGGNPKVCASLDSCHTAGTCTPATGVCSNPVKPDGSACTDGNVCTQTDTCLSGTCAGANPVVCAASDACHAAGTCAPATGACSNPTAPNGTVCTDGNACTQTDTCLSGTCAGANPVVCTASDVCHVAGACAPATGVCSNPEAPDGTACTDGDGCTQTDACLAGACVGGGPVVCTPSDGCHEAGTCAPATGVCSNPTAPDGIACSDANVCTTNDACLGGVCVGQGPASPAEVDEGVLVSQLDGVTTITWNTASGSTWSDVLRGLVGALPVGPGGGDEVCLLGGTAATTATDPDTPNPDEGFWYLIQGGNDCGKGPFGFEVDGGVQTPRVSATCP